MKNGLYGDYFMLYEQKCFAAIPLTRVLGSSSNQFKWALVVRPEIVINSTAILSEETKTRGGSREIRKSPYRMQLCQATSQARPQRVQKLQFPKALSDAGSRKRCRSIGTTRTISTTAPPSCS